jgi:peptidoglycan hydrolase-like protein with peptidoglycan-binding domain
MRRLSLIPLSAAAAALAVPTASAQVLPAPAPTPTPRPPKAGKLGSSLDGGLATRSSRYYSRKGRVVVKGRSSAFAPGQQIRLEVVRRGRVVLRRRTTLRPARRGGRYRFSVRAGRPGLRRLVVSHPGTPQLAGMRAKDKRVQVVRWSAGSGASGTKVLLLQRGLKKLGFATPVGGYFDDGTARAVTAFRKTNGLGTTGYAASGVFDRVLRGRGAFRLKYPGAGKHVEFDWSRQVLVLADKGRPYRVYHASSGKASTPTVFGSYRFYLKTPGTNAKGMVHSNYFVGGYAIHGYPSVPTYPASHGCIRVPIPNAAAIYNWIGLGDRIFVYT